MLRVVRMCLLFLLGGLTKLTSASAVIPVNTYNLTDVSGHTCLLFKAAIKFNIQYINIKKMNSSLTSSVPQQYNISGQCNSSIQHLQIQYYSNWSLNLSFQNETKSKKYHLMRVSLNYNLDGSIFSNPLNNDSQIFVKSNFPSSTLSVTYSHSYYCVKDTTLALGNSVSISFSNLQYQAFTAHAFNGFSEKEQCSADQMIKFRSRDAIAFGVGGGLAGLTLIVLIIYFLGRRRLASNKVV